MRSTRRRWLRVLAPGAGVGLAGCSSGGGTVTTDRTATDAVRSSVSTGERTTEPMASATTVDETTASESATSTPVNEDVLGEPDGVTERASVYRDVPFRDTEDGTLALDFYSPRDAEGPVPLVVHVHGGAWAFGSKGGERFARVPLSAGAAFASVQYRLSGSASFPHPVRDVVAAVAWCREHADDLGVDPARVGLTGESAGGHLSTLVAVAPEVDRLRPDGVSARAARASCVVSVSGVYEFTESFGGALVRQFLGCSPGACADEREAASPVTYVDAGDVPALLYHGTADSVVPYGQAERYVAVADDADAPVELVTGEGGGHVTPYRGSWGDRYERRQRAFLREQLW